MLGHGIVTVMGSKTWRRLAEMVGIETEAGANWSKINRQRNMQRYGTTDRRDKGMTGIEFRNSVQRKNAADLGQPQAPRSMTPKPGGLQIPSGTDRPGQGNPLVAPPRAMVGQRPPHQAAHQHGTSPDDHGMEDDEWLNLLMGDEDDEDEL